MGSPSTPRCSLAKLITRMLLAVATLTLMMAPIKSRNAEGSARQTKKENDNSGHRRWQSGKDDERIQPGLEVDDNQEIDEYHREQQPG